MDKISTGALLNCMILVALLKRVTLSEEQKEKLKALGIEDLDGILKEAEEGFYTVTNLFNEGFNTMIPNTQWSNEIWEKQREEGVLKGIALLSPEGWACLPDDPNYKKTKSEILLDSLLVTITGPFEFIPKE